MRAAPPTGTAPVLGDFAAAVPAALRLDRPRRGRQIPGVVLALLALDLALCAADVVNYFFPIPSGTYFRLVDVDGESSIANWYSSIKFFSIAALFATFALFNVDRSRRESLILWVFPAVFLFFSADESVQIHEWLGRKTDILLPGGDREHTVFQITGIWMFVAGLPFLVFILGVVHRSRRYFTRAPGAIRLFVCGILLLLSGAIGVEILTNRFSDPGSIGFLAEVCSEELLEMLGATVILWAALALLSSSRFTFDFEPVRGG